MTTHTGRLIVVIILFIFTLSSVATGFWFQALVWLALTCAVGYPFVQGDKVDLYYDGGSATYSGGGETFAGVPIIAATGAMP